MKLAVGDLVAYGSHGPGRVVGRPRPKAGSPETVVVEFTAGLSVTLPFERAQEYLRPLATPSEITTKVQRTLRADAVAGEAVWLKRCKETKAKLSLGEPVGLAEVVRDGARRDRPVDETTGSPRLSLSERQLYLKARKLLADEIGLARGVESSEADDWIADQLAR